MRRRAYRSPSQTPSSTASPSLNNNESKVYEEIFFPKYQGQPVHGSEVLANRERGRQKKQTQIMKSDKKNKKTEKKESLQYTSTTTILNTRKRLFT